ncbi:MAG: rod shape-determining protein, partial [candidate division Zixibacteria bacterium]|nr:rod shape-determining protein [candidate division Zixibacteria bacterium]
TDLAVFFEGSIRHSAVIPIGGKNITSDIAIGLRTPLDQAEEIKRKHSSALSVRSEDGHLVEVPGVGGRPARKLSREQLTAIVGPRMEEILVFANRELKRSGFDDLMRAGVVLTGGGALMPGAAELAEQVFGMPAKIGVPDSLGGLVPADTAPMFATGIGLMLYGIENPGKKDWGNDGDHQGIGRIFGRMKRWFGDLA